MAFLKNANLYFSLTSEEREVAIAHCGVDLGDIAAVSEFLQREMGTQGLSAKLLVILQEFMLIPAGTETIWDLITR